MENLITHMNNVLGELSLKAKCVKAERHRHLAFFDLKLDSGCRVKRLETFSREIALGLKSMTEPYIYPISNEGVVRVEVAMDKSDVLHFDELWNDTEAPAGILPFLIGETSSGKPLWVDFAKNPHTLIAGTTGSGKSVLLHLLINNALKRDDVDLYLVDPKRGVEFGSYEEECTSVSYNYEDTLFMLEHLHKKMEERFEKMKKLKLRSIDDMPSAFNKKLVIIDEVSDLMLQDSSKDNPNKGSFERLLVSLAQKSRATGIYIVVATQRPSVDVLTGLIKANFPARISCKVNSATDSKVILDSTGAESLLGKGDAILNNSLNGNVRFQVAFVK